MKLRNFFIIVVTTLSLIGCVSDPTGMRKKAPLSQVESTKASKAVAVCIADRWELSTAAISSYGGLQVHLRPTSTGYTVSVLNSYGITQVLADIENKSEGSTTRFYKNTMTGGVDRHKQDVSDCQQQYPNKG